MASCWVRLLQAKRIPVSENVALRLVLPGVVVTWFVTGLPDLGKADGLRAVPLETALSGRTSLRWRASRRRLATCRNNPMPRFSVVIP
jgi:hypothetical protein